ncbi:MAG: 16S rRNA (cytosine(1402)-N(4))-methyltransferase RsmH [Bacilli bacterium]|nr:16S rRNA (cytosine(1402)-N(4))-methyltransferase RsmH [Bacilli bacterium]
MHISVLLNEAIEYLNLKDSSTVVDMTLGYGGHSSLILKEIKKGFLFAFDQDEEAIKASEVKLKKIGNNYKIIKSNFVKIKNYVKQADAILYDLGVSSPQLDEKERGFSFHQDYELDMRMDKSNPLTAKIIANEYPYEKLIKIFREYGEEKYASSIAKKIVEERKTKEINTTLELVDIISSSVPFKYKREHHPARKVFQAIRIEVNDELNVFEKSLKDALDVLNVGGRVCVITFHSLEDRICKKIFKEYSEIDNNLKKLPIIPEDKMPSFKLITKLTPSKEEIEQNPRSRSATLRVIEKIK